MPRFNFDQVVNELLDLSPADVADPSASEERDHVGRKEQPVGGAGGVREAASGAAAVLDQPPLGVALERLATRRPRARRALGLRAPRLGLGPVVALDALAAELRDRDIAVAAPVDAGHV